MRRLWACEAPTGRVEEPGSRALPGILCLETLSTCPQTALPRACGQLYQLACQGASTEK